MSRTLPEDVNVTETGPGTGSLHLALSLPFSPVTVAPDNQYPPPSAATQTPQEGPNFADGSGPIFLMYLEMAGEEDKKMVEDWKADADGILIFVSFHPIVSCLTPIQWS